MRHNIFLISLIVIFCNKVSAQQDKEPWNSKQLLEPAILASRIDQDQTDNLLILSVGPDVVIKGSVDIGPAQEPANIEKLKNYLKNVPKDKEVVIYCGCCPFDRCPNIRPAFKELKKMELKDPRLLNIRKNIKVDWIDKDYPMND